MPLGAPDLEDMVRRKVADAMRDMFRSYAKNGNGALRRVLRDEASSWPAVPGPDAVDNDGGAIEDAVRAVTCVEEAENVMTPDGEGEGSDADAEDIAAEDTDFSSAVDHVLHNMPVTDTRNGFKAYGFEARAALRRITTADAAFKSEAQKEAMVAVAERRGDLTVVLATGGGKTAGVIGPCLFEEGVTVWVSPLRALLRETDMRLKNAGIQRPGWRT